MTTAAIPDLLPDAPILAEPPVPAKPLASAMARVLMPNRAQVELRASDLESLLPEGHRADLFEPEIVLGIVTERYEPLQNIEAFSFFDPIVDQKSATFETAGALDNGERVWVLAKMPEVIEVVRGDNCEKYLLLSNTHTGQGSVIVKFTAVRVVCQNTLMLSLQDGQHAFRVRHSRKMSECLAEVGELIAAANAAYMKAAEDFRRIAKFKIKNEAMLDSYLKALFPLTESQERDSREPPKWRNVKQLLETSPDSENFKVVVASRC